MAGFRAVPDALRTNVRFLDDAADAYHAAAKEVEGAEMDALDLGLLGMLAGVPGAYAAALTEVVGSLQLSGNMLVGGSAALKTVAEEYESRDEKYYRKFGYEIG
ncbi:MAG: hypothetical protein ACRDT0_11520 [Pseudonocardiaceae bacterium]